MAAESYPGEAVAAYGRRIAEIARELEIPADYGCVRQLPLQAEATDLESIGANPEGVEIRLAPRAAAGWRHLREAAAQAGLTLLPISGYRSVDRQIQIIRAKREAGEPILEILRRVAAPGYSEHHTGRAIDIGAPDEPLLAEGFAETAAFRWLERYGPHYGFKLSFPRDNRHQIVFEPWHWCCIG